MTRIRRVGLDEVTGKLEVCRCRKVLLINLELVYDVGSYSRQRHLNGRVDPFRLAKAECLGGKRRDPDKRVDARQPIQDNYLNLI